MSELRIVDLNGGLPWNEFQIPGGSLPVQMVTLHVEPSRARSILVRFPPGWERPDPGWYECAEEFVVLDGAFAMSGETYRAGDWAYVPAGSVRVATASRPEALVLARFDGPARWHASLHSAPPVIRARLDEKIAPVPTRVGNLGGRLLRSGNPASWVLSAIRDTTVDYRVELLSLPSLVWASVPPGEPLPALEAPLFCRSFEEPATRDA
jgi:hypothetical protein